MKPLLGAGTTLLALFGAGCSGGTTSNGAGSGGSSTVATGATATAATASSASATSTAASGSTGASGSCIGSSLMASLGKTNVITGVSTSDTVAASAPFDIRYQYISGGYADGGPCASCASGCTASGKSCANSAGGCAWWGCWQSDQDPPGAFVRNFISTAASHGEIPMFSYYEVLQASGVVEGKAEVDIMNDPAFAAKYFDDFRFLLKQVGMSTAIIHVEPDFWGYAEQSNGDPHQIPAAVSANGTDCAGLEQSFAGLGRCLVKMARTYAPNAKISLHGSAWATKMDVLLNASPTFDVAGEAGKLASFLKEAAPDADLIVIDASDRDAQYYQSMNRNTWWDATNMTLPDFHQAFAWSKALSEGYGKPNLWWQVPVGNKSLAGGANHWQDNRVDYFYGHWGEVAASHGVGAAFGAGQGDQTNPETDGGNLVAKTQAYASSGGVKVCPVTLPP